MKELSIQEIDFVAGGKFKLHFNPIQIISGLIVGFTFGGPIGALTAVGVGIISQGVGGLNEQSKEMGWPHFDVD